MQTEHQGTNYQDLIALARAGVSVSDAEALCREWQIPVARFATILGVSERKWSRLRGESSTAKLGPVESDRLIRLRKTLEHALAVFNSPDDAALWFAMPNRALSGDVPIALMDTDAGVHAVDAVLTRLEFSVFA